MDTPIHDSFLQLLNENLGIAHKVCRIYFQDQEDQKDVLQEMMYQLWRSYPGFDGRSRFSTWMYRVCLNTSLTYQRKSKKQQKETLRPAHQQIPDPPADPQNERSSLLDKAIAHLSPVNKAIVLLYLEDLRYDEIAAITGLSKSNVSVRLVRIKKELETLITKTPNASIDVNIR